VPSDAFSTLGPRSLLDGMLALTLVAAVLWLCAVATVWGRQERLIFRPDARPLGEVPADLAEVRFRQARLRTRDGLELTFWAAEPLPGMPTLLLFHGNAGNAADRAPPLVPFAAAGYGVVLAEYPAAMPAIRAALPRLAFSAMRGPTSDGFRRLGRNHRQLFAVRASVQVWP
jgi:hypothetical protein